MTLCGLCDVPAAASEEEVGSRASSGQICRHLCFNRLQEGPHYLGTSVMACLNQKTASQNFIKLGTPHITTKQI